MARACRFSVPGAAGGTATDAASIVTPGRRASSVYAGLWLPPPASVTVNWLGSGQTCASRFSAGATTARTLVTWLFGSGPPRPVYTWVDNVTSLTPLATASRPWAMTQSSAGFSGAVEPATAAGAGPPIDAAGVPHPTTAPRTKQV